MERKIALAGNPNSGKTTMFNDLTGSNQRVGNWPGVTVEKKEGKLKDSTDIVLQDLPGIYSLSPYTLEEVVSRNYLINERPDAILNIVDATNIERNLYLTTQLLELGIPTVIALNMIDVVRKNGDVIDLEKLGSALGCEVVETSALKGNGSREAAKKASALARTPKAIHLPAIFAGSVEHAIAHIEESIENMVPSTLVRWYAIKLFERDEKVCAELKLDPVLLAHLEEHVHSCELEMDDDAESIIIDQRYKYIEKIVHLCVKKEMRQEGGTVSDRIDRIVTDRILALPIFVAIMWLVYYISMSTVGALFTDWTNEVLFGEIICGNLQTWFEGMGVAVWLTDLVVNGIIGGVGAVIGFVPQMLLLFLMLSILEDVGYMSRVAFIMDQLFRRFGLSGKSFIPMLIGSGCSVPGVMATRTIESERDRRMTIMTTSFIPCGAKMPMVGLIASALFGGAAWVATSAYFIGVLAVVISGLILKKTKPFAGDPAPFVMELPPYHVPSLVSVLRATWERGWSFIVRAGTVILIASVVIWFLSNLGFHAGHFGFVESMDESILATMGGMIAFLFQPLGFGSWQAAVATLMGLMAKEEIVGVFGVLSSMGDADVALGMVEAADSAGLQPLAATFFGGSALAGFSFMIFNLLCAPCFAAIGAIKREMNSAKWTWATIGYMCGMAYVVSLMVFQLGTWIHTGIFGLGTVAALLILVGMLYLLFRKNPNIKSLRK